MPRYWPNGMGGPISVPASCALGGRLPCRMAVLISASVHVPMPVSGSGVILDGMAVKALPSSMGGPPDNALSRIGPFGPTGVWQLPQPMMLSTRYLPRSTGVWAVAEPAVRHAAAVTAAAMTLYMWSPPRRRARTYRRRLGIASCGDGQCWLRRRGRDHHHVHARDRHGRGRSKTPISRGSRPARPVP